MSLLTQGIIVAVAIVLLIAGTRLIDWTPPEG